MTLCVLGDGTWAVWLKERRLWFTVRGTCSLNTPVFPRRGRREDRESRGLCSQATVLLSLQAPGVLAPPAQGPRARCSLHSVQVTKGGLSKTETRGRWGTAPGSASRLAPGARCTDQHVPPVALWAETQDDEGRAGLPRPGLCMHSSVFQQRRLWAPQGLLKMPQGGRPPPRRSRGQSVFRSFPESGSRTPVKPSPAQPPEGQLRLPHGNTGLSRTPEHSIGKGLGCCLLPPAHPREQFLLHLTHTPAPASAFKWTKPGRDQNTEPRADVGCRLGLQPPHLENG